MNGEELFDTLRLNILKDRATPPLWSDDRMVEVLNEAYLEFAEESQIIRDGTSEVATVTLESGVESYEYDRSILSVLSAKYEGMIGNLTRIGVDQTDGDSNTVGTYEWLAAVNAQYPNGGTPVAYRTDDSLYMMTFHPTPAADDEGKVVRLRVARLPIELLTVDNLAVDIEIPRQYVMGIAHGAAAIAYSDQDADGYDPNQAAVQRGKFEAYLARAKRGMKRQMFQPITWGFGNR